MQAKKPVEQGDVNELMCMEFENVSAQFQANEEMGEKRVSLMVTMTAALGAAAGFAHEKIFAGSHPELWIALNIAWILFGYLTLLRILERNVASDRYKERLRRLRQWFVSPEDEKARRHLPFDPYRDPGSRSGLFFRAGAGGKGGYAELVAFVNVISAAALGWQLGYQAGWTAGGQQWQQRLAGVLLGGLAGWLWWRAQARLAAAFYRRAGSAQ